MNRLVGYIGGWSVELAQVTEKKGKPHFLQHQLFESPEYSNFESVLGLYLRKTKASFDVACFGVAGPVIHNRSTTTVLHWDVDGEKIADKFEIGRVKLVNNLVATAHALPHLSEDQLYLINEGVPDPDGNLGIVAAGFGLGEAIVYRDGKNLYPYASEGGHVDFAPGNQLESELWEYLYSELGVVEAEDVVSLAGLEHIYQFLVDTNHGSASGWFSKAKDRPSAIIEKALSGKGKTAARALDLFIDCYASEAANLALTGMTTGGIYIAGLIAPRIVTALDQGRFMERFIKKGKMEKLLSDTPVSVVIEERAPLLGAARVALSM